MSRPVAQWQVRFLTVGLIAGILSVIGAFLNPKQFFLSYLFSYLFWIGLGAGCIVVAMIHYLSGGQWGHPIRRFLEAGFSTIPLFAILFIPILFGLGDLYPWARAGELPEKIIKKEPYLGKLFFILRAFVILGIWIFWVLRLRKWSLAQDATEDSSPTRHLATLSGPGLVIIPLTATFAYIDWIMSTEPRWYSTIFAIIILAGQVLVTYAFCVILLKLFERVGPLAEIVGGQHYHQLGNLLLTFVLFWTYVGFSQLLIIYSGNKPDEIRWYLHRIAGGWRYLLGIIAFFHFFLPFMLLLLRSFKRRSTLLAGLACIVVAVHLLYSYWLVGPSIFPDGIHLNWLNFAVPVALGGVWLGAFFWFLERAPLMPLNDPRVREEIAHAEA
jgi:hypothetical protein